MKSRLFILLIILFFLSACQYENKKGEIDLLYNSFENLFFKLDFEEENVTMDELKKHFFTNFPHNDPTQGDVIYDRKRWLDKDLFDLREKSGLFAYLRYRNDSLGYDSYRLTSKAYYNLNNQTGKILFVYKGSLPSSNGVWPAWWLNGSTDKSWTYSDSIPSLSDESLEKYSGIGEFYNTSSAVNNTDWPAAGEIDIIENINGQNLVHNTLHTCPQMCDSEWNNDGIIINCANGSPRDVNKGCSGNAYQIDSLEGTFACIWEENEISFYYWPPKSDIRRKGGPLSEEPKPDTWSKKSLKNRVKLLETNEKCKHFHQDWQCRICENSKSCHFKNMKMIFNVTICGMWAGLEFDESDESLENCKDYILGEGKEDIDGAHMKIEYIAVKKL